MRDCVVTCPGHFWRYDLRTGARADTVGEPLNHFGDDVLRKHAPARADPLREAGERFDVVLNMEVVEHVADPLAYLTACQELSGPPTPRPIYLWCRAGLLEDAVMGEVSELIVETVRAWAR